MLQTVTNMLSAALRRARQYEEKMCEERCIEGTSVLKQGAFEEILQTRRETGERDDSVLCKLVERGGSAEEESAAIELLIRETDFMGKVGEELFIFLTGTDLDGFRVFEQRLQEQNISVRLVEEM